ncbi:MAG: hypothetical protein RLZZ267_502 [Bacillota bacterium]|jgi:inner membrane protein
MDTLTHVALGLGLAGLAHIDPVVANNPEVATAVMACTLIAQQAPDSDLVLRIGGNALYTREHRGTSHSLPAIPLWTFLTAGIVHWFNPEAPFLTLLLWSFIGVFVHILSDVFNSYGTKALWPVHKKWIHLHVIPIFDPFLFATHVITLILWKAGNLPPAPLFMGLYLIIVGYYAWRCLERADVSRKLEKSDTIIPTFSWTIWNVIRKREDGSYQLGEWRNGELEWQMKVANDHHPAIEASKTTREVSALLHFSIYSCATVQEIEQGYRVRWSDVRFRFKYRLPFGATVVLDKDFNIIKSKISWG